MPENSFVAMNSYMIELMRLNCIKPIPLAEVSRLAREARDSGDAERLGAITRFARFRHYIDW